MDKKTKTIVIAVAVVVVVGGLYYGVNRWRQQRLANQILKEVYGVNAGLLGNLPGGNSAISNQVAKEIAKEAAQQKADEAREAAKTPEDKYNEAKVASVIGSVSPVVTNEIQPALAAVFGKVKMISYGTGYLPGQSGSFGANFKVPRVVTGEDLNKLASELKNKGYTALTSDVESDSGTVTFMKGEQASVTVTYSNSGENQEVEVIYLQMSAE